MACAFAVADDLAGERGGGLGHKLVELVRVRFDAGRAGSQQQHGVVGGHAAVHVDAVERHFDSGVQGGLKLSGGHDGIGGDDAQHGGQLRGDHAGTLDHATDTEAVGTFQLDGFRLGVGGHDGVRRIGSGFGGIGKGFKCLVRAGQHVVERQQFADETSGTYGHVFGFGADEAGDLFSGGLGLLVSWLAGACVGAAGVQNHGLHMAVGYDVPRPLHRGRAETVRGEHAGSGVKRSIVDHESQILLAFDRGNASCHASCGKTLCERYAHGATPIFVNPASSGSPNATFSDCTDCPAVPRLRLSMAANASRRPA